MAQIGDVQYISYQRLFNIIYIYWSVVERHKPDVSVLRLWYAELVLALEYVIKCSFQLLNPLRNLRKHNI